MITTARLKLLLVLSLVAFLSSAATLSYLELTRQEAVYVIGAVTITDPERLPEYRSISEPLAYRVGGYQPLAFFQPEVLEGELPVDALYFVERYDSVEQMHDFLAELEVSGGLELRNSVADMHFLLALPAYRD